MRTPLAFDVPIYVTRPLLPRLDDYIHSLRKIWESQQLTNLGDLERLLEERLGGRLGAANLSLVGNGTLALMLACRSLDLAGEVITTPFTFPATPHALLWCGVRPVFADIDAEMLTLDPDAAERAITPATSGILGVHVYGMPCDVRRLQDIADRNALKVVYDAAHAFGTTIGGVPISRFGDAVTFSFHATKLFHTAEGGAIASRDQDTKKRVDLLRNFGIESEAAVVESGINAKLNEFQAALGLHVLDLHEAELEARACVDRVYRERLSDVAGIRCLSLPTSVGNSLQYFVLRVSRDECGIDRDGLIERLKAFNVFARRYFYPLCSDYPHFRDLPSSHPENLPVANRVAKEVVCLPFYGALGQEGANRICDMIESIVR